MLRMRMLYGIDLNAMLGHFAVLILTKYEYKQDTFKMNILFISLLLYLLLALINPTRLK